MLKHIQVFLSTLAVHWVALDAHLVNWPNYAGTSDIVTTTGYIEDLFYMLYQSPTAPKTDRTLLLWFQGGPGCSGFLGAMTEMGPFYTNGTHLLDRDVNWMQLNVSVMVIDQPYNTGFSTSKNTVLSDLAAAKVNARFLQSFSDANPHFTRIIISGESHGGLYIPLLLQELMNTQAKVLDIITHVTLGNPRFSCTEMIMSPWEAGYVKRISFRTLHYRGLVPFQLVAQWDDADCDNNATQALCVNLLTEVEKSVPRKTGYLSNSNFLYQKCRGAASLDFPAECPSMTIDEATENYLNEPEVQLALGVNTITSWNRCNNNITKNWTFDGGSMVPILGRIAVDHAIPVLVYNGDLDILQIPPAMTRYCLAKSTKFKSNGTQTPWFVDPLWAGMKEVYTPGNLVWKSVHGAGHLVPGDAPEVALQMMAHFIRN